MKGSWLIIAVLARSSCAEDTEPKESLRKVSHVYTQANALEVEAEAIIRYDDNQPSSLRLSVRPVYGQPDHLRIETRHASGRMILISKRNSIVEYREDRNVFFRAHGTAEASFAPTTKRGGGIGEMVYDTIADGIFSAKLDGFEKLSLQGVEHECLISHVRYKDATDSTFRFWIDKMRHAVLRRSFVGVREDGIRQSTFSTVTFLKINESLPKQIFDFEPPLDAREITPLNDWQICLRVPAYSVGSQNQACFISIS